ncbi:hypothetical protein PG994_010305 [Apiospora phragmitis]|uniref:Restriction of telomere capping protein 4 n=1 Tax=Apiospora phragmitis TaxID=2905665 RepID=A0ABR1TRT2_9PEZI
MVAGMRSRRVGLSTREKNVNPLLSTYQSAPETKMEDVEDITAPPLSTDDESEAPPKAESQGSDSDDGWQSQRDMVKTKFQAGKRSRSPEPGMRRNVRAKTTAPSTRRARGRTLIRPASHPGRVKMTPGETEAKHLTDSIGFPKHSKTNKTFGNGKTSQRSSQNSAPKSSAPQGLLPKLPHRRDITNFVPESSKKSGLKRHRLSESPSGTPEKAIPPKAKFIPPSPIKSPSLSLAKDSSKSNRKQRPALKPPVADELDEIDSVSDGGKTQRSRNDGNTAKVEAEKLPRRPAFKVPQLEGLGSIADKLEGVEVLSTQQLGFMDNGLLNDGLNTELSSDEDIFANNSRRQPSLAAHCPLCGQTVDSELLRKYTTRGRMTIRQQTTFCLSHKRKEAEETRRCNRYPEVDWDALEARFTEHKDFIKSILEGERASHFASLLGNKVETGKDRTLLKTDESLTPGYYGPRGLRLMTEFIMHHFSDTVRKRAVEDPLVSARTYTGYVQSVLVSELAVRLIMEDMDVDEEDARRIMQESSALGDVLHEETRDVVVRDSDDED